AANPELPDEEIASTVRHNLSRALYRERVAVTGPDKRVPEKMGEVVLHDEAVRKAIADEVAEGKSQAAVEARAFQIIARMFANLNYPYIDAADWFLKALWRITGVKLVYDTVELGPVKEAARKGPLVLCPMHRSHVDYLILSQIFYENGLVVPHIAAGDNLSFWPMGHIFRNMGAFFIRRTFKGDPLYGAIFRSYMRHLLREGWTTEFFMEGTRSRNGKMLPPKMGLLDSIVDARMEGACEDIHFVPISIMYEKVVEGEAYMKELLGGSKSKEDFGALIKTTGVLTSKYGNIYVRFGQPVSLEAFMKLRGVGRDSFAADKRKAVEALGYDIVHKIGAITTVSPSPVVSTVLLTARGPISVAETVRRAQWLIELIGGRQQVKLSPAFNNIEGAVAECLSRFERDKMARFVDGVGYTVSPRARLQLDYYKNSLMHFIFPTAIAASTIRTFEGHAAVQEVVFRATRVLGELFRYEFNFEVNVPFDEQFIRELEVDMSRGLVELSDEVLRLRPDAEPMAAFFAATLDNFCESYLIAGEALALLRRQPVERKEFVMKAQDLGRSMLGRGRIELVESLSKQNIDNAFSLFIKMGVVLEVEQSAEEDTGKKRKPQLYTLSPESDVNMKIQELRSRLLLHLGRK
ncbi:MAG: 1-acyl-sn-glycerol-3-phosphate acyltransferase, partial [Myxococcota bacterium]